MSRTATDTKYRIISAAKKLFVQHGFKGTSTKQIAREAGISEMTLFRHFPTKERVFREVIQPLISFLDNLQFGDGHNLKTLVKQMLQDRLTFLCEERELVRLVLMESYLTSLSFNPIAETADRIRSMFSSIDKSKGDLYLRLIMGFILTCIFLPEKCDGFTADLDQLVNLLE